MVDYIKQAKRVMANSSRYKDPTAHALDQEAYKHLKGSYDNTGEYIVTGKVNEKLRDKAEHLETAYHAKRLEERDKKRYDKLKKQFGSGHDMNAHGEGKPYGSD